MLFGSSIVIIYVHAGRFDVSRERIGLSCSRVRHGQHKRCCQVSAWWWHDWENLQLVPGKFLFCSQTLQLCLTTSETTSASPTLIFGLEAQEHQDREEGEKRTSSRGT